MAKKVFCIGNGESRIGFDLEKLRSHGTIYGCNALYRDFMPDVIVAVDYGIMHEIYHADVAQKIPCYFRDWTKVPAMTYEPMLYGGMSKLEADEHIKDIVVSNDRGDSKEYVMHGANLQGIVTMIKKNGDKYKKNVNNSQIKVSWITDNDKSNSLTDIMGGKDHGWSSGASSTYVAISREQPDEVYLIGHDIYSTNDKVNNVYKSTKHYVAKENGPTPTYDMIDHICTLSDWYPDVKFIKINRYNDGRDQVNGPIKEFNNRKNILYADYSTLDNLA